MRNTLARQQTVRDIVAAYQATCATVRRSELRTAIEASRAGETTWCKYRVFANGNAHLAFTRLDLVKRMNEVAGGKRLRPDKRRPVADGDGMVVFEPAS